MAEGFGQDLATNLAKTLIVFCGIQVNIQQLVRKQEMKRKKMNVNKKPKKTKKTKFIPLKKHVTIGNKFLMDMTVTEIEQKLYKLLKLNDLPDIEKLFKEHVRYHYASLIRHHTPKQIKKLMPYTTRRLILVSRMQLKLQSRLWVRTNILLQPEIGQRRSEEMSIAQQRNRVSQPGC